MELSLPCCAPCNLGLHAVLKAVHAAIHCGANNCQAGQGASRPLLSSVAAAPAACAALDHMRPFSPPTRCALLLVVCAAKQQQPRSPTQVPPSPLQRQVRPQGSALLLHSSSPCSPGSCCSDSSNARAVEGAASIATTATTSRCRCRCLAVAGTSYHAYLPLPAIMPPWSAGLSTSLAWHTWL